MKYITTLFFVLVVMVTLANESLKIKSVSITSSDLNKKSLSFMTKNCSNLATYNWNNTEFNKQLLSISKTKLKSRKLLITGGVFGVTSLAMLLGGGISTAKNFPFEGDIYDIGPIISMSLGGGLAAIYLPALIKGSIDYKKSKKRLKQLCKQF